METTNKITFESVTKKTEEGYIKVAIKLYGSTDKCTERFSITFEENKYKSFSERGEISCGSCYDTITKYFPEYKIFADLHLSDCNGLPMYAIENGNYHFRNSGEKITKEYLRLDDELYNKLVKLRTVEGLIGYTDLLSRWKNEANEAITLIEKLTGKKFASENLIEI